MARPSRLPPLKFASGSRLQLCITGVHFWNDVQRGGLFPFGCRAGCSGGSVAQNINVIRTRPNHGLQYIDKISTLLNQACPSIVGFGLIKKLPKDRSGMMVQNV